MAPTLSAESLEKRQYGYGYCNGYNCYGNSAWNNWGRWVALVVIIVFALLVAILFSCFNARRRRRRGLAPYRGTGWMAGKPAQYQSNQGYYNNGAGAYNAGPAAPPYTPGPVNEQYTGNTFNRNDGYYGQNNGIELQQPQTVYQPGRGGDPVYAAPQGPPPAKTGY